jgi:hypothetical protein
MNVIAAVVGVRANSGLGFPCRSDSSIVRRF